MRMGKGKNWEGQRKVYVDVCACHFEEFAHMCIQIEDVKQNVIHWMSQRRCSRGLQWRAIVTNLEHSWRKLDDYWQVDSITKRLKLMQATVKLFRRDTWRWKKETRTAKKRAPQKIKERHTKAFSKKEKEINRNANLLLCNASCNFQTHTPAQCLQSGMMTQTWYSPSLGCPYGWHRVA